MRKRVLPALRGRRQRHRRRRLAVAYWRDTLLLLRQFRWSLMAFLGLLFGGAGWLLLFYEERTLSFGEALYATLMFMFLNPVLEFPRSGGAQVPFFLVPILGAGLIAGAIVQFGILLFTKNLRQEEWQKVMASLYRNHIVVVGVGRVGFRVIRELLQAGKEVVALAPHDDEETHAFIEQLRSEGVPVVVGDPRRRDVLGSVQIGEASCLLICTEGDLLNLEVALTARDLNPNLKIVLRLFSDALAEHAEKHLGVSAALSTSAIAAPALAAAALGRRIAHAFYIGDQLFYVAEVHMDADSPLKGVQTVADIEWKYRLSVVYIRHPNGEVIFHPPASQSLQLGDILMLIGDPDHISALQK